jgi:hypothetical protein
MAVSGAAPVIMRSYKDVMNTRSPSHALVTAKAGTQGRAR